MKLHVIIESKKFQEQKELKYKYHLIMPRK